MRRRKQQKEVVKKRDSGQRKGPTARVKNITQLDDAPRNRQKPKGLISTIIQFYQVQSTLTLYILIIMANIYKGPGTPGTRIRPETPGSARESFDPVTPSFLEQEGCNP